MIIKDRGQGLNSPSDSGRGGIWNEQVTARYERLAKDPFYSNSFYVILANMLAAGCGLLFWILAAREYSKDDIGLATALISSSSIILLVSRMGIDQTMARFLPTGDRASIFSTTNIITTVLSLAVGLVYVLTANYWLPNIEMDWWVAFVFIVLIVAQGIATTSNQAFIAIRMAKISMVQNLVMGSRILLLFVFTALGSLGVISAFTLSFVLAVIFGQIVLTRLQIRLTKVDWQFLRMSMQFSVGNWISSLLTNLPIYLLPIMVLGALGAESTAEYYMAYSFASIVFMFPKSTATQMFVEGCHGEEMGKIVKRSMITSFAIVIPITAVVILLAPWLLDLLGKDYAENALDLLRLIAFSSIFLITYQIYYSVKLVQKDMKGLVLISLINSILIIGFSYYFMVNYGLSMMGYGWILGYGLCNVIILFTYLYGRR